MPRYFFFTLLLLLVRSYAPFCHPANTMLEQRDGRRIPISALSTGDEVRTAHGFEPVIAFTHREAELSTPFVSVHAGNFSMSVSPGHYMFVNGVKRDPDTVAVGDEVSTPWGSERVSEVARSELRGAYHLVTPSGSYFADGILVTDYVAELPTWVWQLIKLLYLTPRFHLGVPPTPQGEGSPTFWLGDTLDALGVDMSIRRKWLWPLTLPIMVVTEAVASTLRSVASSAISAPMGGPIDSVAPLAIGALCLS